MTRKFLLWATLAFILSSTLVLGRSHVAAQEIQNKAPKPAVRVEKMTEAEVRSFLKKQGLSDREIEQRLTGNPAEASPDVSSPATDAPAAVQATYYYHDRGFMASCGNSAVVVSYLAPGSAYIGVTNFSGALTYWTGWFWSEGYYYRATFPGGSYKAGRGVSVAYPYVSGVGCA